MAKVDFLIERNSLQGLPDRTERILAGWQISAREKIEAYFKRIDGEKIHITGPVVLSLEQFKCIAKSSSFDREVRGVLSATVDRGQKTEKVHCVRNYNPQMRGAKLSGEAGNRWVETLRDVVSGDRAAAALTPEVFAKDPFFTLLNISIMEKLDSLLGRNTASVVTRWRFAQMLVWLATALSAVIVFFKATDQPVGPRLIACLVVAFVTYLLTYALAACCMPASFFENYGAGQRVMRLAGTSTGRETQTKIRLVTALAIFGLGLMAYVMYTTFQ